MAFLKRLPWCGSLAIPTLEPLSRLDPLYPTLESSLSLTPASYPAHVRCAPIHLRSSSTLCRSAWTRMHAKGCALCTSHGIGLFSKRHIAAVVKPAEAYPLVAYTRSFPCTA
jgi:hypothetical protein